MSIAQELKLEDALERIKALEKRVQELEASAHEADQRTLHLKDKADGKRQ